MLNYFNHRNSFLHGIMFHHFHDNAKHKKQQGSISADELVNIIKYIGRENIINANEFCDEVKLDNFNQKKVCFTFDDSLLCQYDVALPILEDFNIKSFFFLYSSIYDGKPDMLEVYRYFRMNFFDEIDKFYEVFFDFFQKNTNYYNLDNFNKDYSSEVKKLLTKAPYLSFNDSKFRVIRDLILKKEDYQNIMNLLFKHFHFDYHSILNKLFISKDQLLEIHRKNNIIGLHSHSHPTQMGNLSYSQQYNEYKKTIDVFETFVGKSNINSMSHPNGNYNNDTLEILKNLNISIGFRANMNLEDHMTKINNSSLELARENHSNIMNYMSE